MSLKSELTCNICKLVLEGPVSLPCLSAICGEHLRDGTAKNEVIKCMKCEKDFEVSRSGFTPIKIVDNILTKGLYLSKEENAIKQAIQDLITKLEQLQSNLTKVLRAWAN